MVQHCEASYPDHPLREEIAPDDLLLEVYDWTNDKQKRLIGSTKISLASLSEKNGEY